MSDRYGDSILQSIEEIHYYVKNVSTFYILQLNINEQAKSSASEYSEKKADSEKTERKLLKHCYLKHGQAHLKSDFLFPIGWSFSQSDHPKMLNF